MFKPLKQSMGILDELRKLTEGIRFELQTEVEQIGDELRHTTYLKHPSANCRAIVREWWTKKE